jgi:hypothetical protein
MHESNGGGGKRGICDSAARQIIPKVVRIILRYYSRRDNAPRASCARIKVSGAKLLAEIISCDISEDYSVGISFTFHVKSWNKMLNTLEWKKNSNKFADEFSTNDVRLFLM